MTSGKIERLTVHLHTTRATVGYADGDIVLGIDPGSAFLRSELTLRSLASSILALERCRAERPNLAIFLTVWDDHWIQLRTDMIENVLDRCQFPTRLEVSVETTPRRALGRSLAAARASPSEAILVSDTEHLHDSIAFRAALEELDRGERDAAVCTAGPEGPLLACDPEAFDPRQATRIRATVPALSSRISGPQSPVPSTDWKRWWNETRFLLG